MCHFQVKLKAGYDPCVGSKITRLKTVIRALTPLLLAASALASSLPYSATVEKDPTAELSALQDKWADHLALARQDTGSREARRNDREHSWNPKAGSHGRYLGTPETASSTGSSTTSNAASGDNSGLSSPWTGHALDFQSPSGLSNYVSRPGGAWENLGGRWPDDRLEDRNLHNFEGFHTMRDPPVSFDPPDAVPEPAYTGFLLAGFFVAALFFYRRFQLHY